MSYWGRNFLRRATIRTLLGRTIRREKVIFTSIGQVIVCVDGRKIGEISNDQREASVHQQWAQALFDRIVGKVHWPGGVYGLVLIPVLEVLQARGFHPTADHVRQMTNRIHEAFTRREMPFIWHDDESTHEESKGARAAGKIGCAAVKAAKEGRIPELRGGDRVVAEEAYVSASEHPEGVRATYAGEHKELAFLINLSDTYTIAGSPDKRGHQWFVIDLVRGTSLLRELSTDLLSIIQNQFGVSLPRSQFQRELEQDAVRFGMGATRYLAGSRGIDIYTLPERFDPQDIRRVDDIRSLNNRYSIDVDE